MIDIDIFRILATIINFTILYLILRHFLFKPVNATLDSRQNEIVTRLNNAEENEKKAETMRIENEEKLNKAKEDGKAIVENYKIKAETVSQEIIKEANSEAELLLNRAKKELDREIEKANKDIKTQVVDLAVMLSSKALEETIDEEQHRRLIKEFIAKVGM